MAQMTNDPKRSPNGEENVPETWQGYLSGNQPRPADADQGISQAQREFLRRGQTEDDDFERAEVSQEELLKEARRSKAEGVEFGSLLPFFGLLGLVMFGLFFYAWTVMQPEPYDVSGMGPPDKPAEQVVRDFFRVVRGGGQLTRDLVLHQLEIGRVEFGKNAPKLRGKFMGRRLAEAAAMIQNGTFQAKFETPKMPDDGLEGLRYVDYERTDKGTGLVTQERLWLARVPDGWRVVGFEN
jgi:hypothetical protein